MQLMAIERIVRQGATYLADTLFNYWPATGENELPERNISLHAGRAFADRGFNVYAECALAGSPMEHIDMLALHPDGVLAAIEAKRLLDSEHAGKMADDVNKILRFRLPNEEQHEIAPAHRFGILVATTWDRRFATWWSSSDDGDDDPTPHENWSKLGTHPALVDAKWGSVVLRGYDDERASDEPFHYLLYSIWKLKPE